MSELPDVDDAARLTSWALDTLNTLDGPWWDGTDPASIEPELSHAPAPTYSMAVQDRGTLSMTIEVKGGFQLGILVVLEAAVQQLQETGAGARADIVTALRARVDSMLWGNDQRA